MAGEWLKMECSTPDKPEVFSITAKMGWDDPDLTVGKLFRVWRWFDQQTTDGNAAGVTAALLDRIAGVTGFAQAMVEVGWLTVSDAGLELPNFTKHNGATAKSRAQTSKRVANHRASMGCNAPTVTPPLAREEKRREEVNLTPKESASTTQPTSTASGRLCARLRKAGIQGVNPSNPKLIAMLAAGIPEDEFCDLACEDGARGKSLAWLLAAVAGRRKDAASAANPPVAVKEWHETVSGIEAKAKELGVPREPGKGGMDTFPEFKSRVFRAAGYCDAVAA